MPELPAFFMEQAAAGTHIQFVYDVPARRVVFVNAAYQTVLGGTLAQVNEELPALLARLHPDDRVFLAYYWKLWVRGQMPDETDIRLQQQGAADQWFCLTPSYQQLAQGRVLVGGTLRDISEQKAYQANADRFNTRKNAVLEILSHDLSGSFAMVQQIADFLRAEVPASADSRVPELLHVLETTSQNSRKMIRDLVAVEFLASANTDLKRTRVEVGAVLREPLDQLQQGQELLGYQFTYSLPPEPVYANLDVNKFTQVLTNLISNAFKFTPDGGQVTVAVEACPGCVRVHVQDSGIGIPADLQPRLFERFTPARRPGLRGEPTIGLGLMLCKTIVEWHQGTLSVVSTEGQGSTFTVEIPQAELERLATSSGLLASPGTCQGRDETTCVVTPLCHVATV
jgi:two-component system sensor histidine kinase VicK